MSLLGRFNPDRSYVEVAFADAYRRLSVRVIDQALRDLVAAPGSSSDRASARRFLSGCPMLNLWCEVAALDASRITAHAGHLMKRGPASAVGRPFAGRRRWADVVRGNA
jgi:hypothetical protein